MVILRSCCLVIALFSSTISWSSNTNRLPIFRVDTEEKSPWQIGSLLGKQWKTQFPDLERQHDYYLASLLNQQRFDELLVQRVIPLRTGGIDNNYLEEFGGLSSQLNLVANNRLGDGLLSIDELMFMQLLPDLGQYGNGCGFGVYGGSSEQSTSILGYNLDDIGILNKLAAITVYKNAEGSIVSIGIAGSLGIVAGFNQAGLFLAYLHAPPGSLGGDSNSEKYAIGFMVRHALETESDISSAATVFKNKRFNESHSLLLADSTRIFILEQMGGDKARLRLDSSTTKASMEWGKADQIAAVNCLALADNKSRNCYSLIDLHRWQRFRELAKFQAADLRGGVTDVIAIMLDQNLGNSAIFTPRTMQSMVFMPKIQELYLYKRNLSDPAGKKPTLHRYTNLLENERIKQGISLKNSLIWAWVLLGLLLVIIAIVKCRTLLQQDN